MGKQSAGLLLYKRQNSEWRVLLVHPGGPFWAKKDSGAWSIPKGEFAADEEPLAAAYREFAEELGANAPEGEPISLGSAKQKSGKVVYVWALEADFDSTNISSNLITLEWPPRSGNQQEFPEVDRAAWFPFKTAQKKLISGQLPLLEELAVRLGSDCDTEEERPEQKSLF